MTNVDLAVHLHFALFHGSGGYVLKPPGMRAGATDAATGQGWIHDESIYWPPPCDRLKRVTIDFLSLHNCTKRGEHRPKLDGSRGRCHDWAPELSGSAVRPRAAVLPSSPGITLSLHPVGGFCAVSTKLPLPHNMDTDIVLSDLGTNGLNMQIGKTLHCVAAEPHATLVRVGVTDGGQEVAYVSAVLGRLQRGYRVFQARSSTNGTRIELCYLLVRISHGMEANLWISPRQLERQLREYSMRSEGRESTLTRDPIMNASLRELPGVNPSFRAHGAEGSRMLGPDPVSDDKSSSETAEQGTASVLRAVAASLRVQASDLEMTTPSSQP
jgi:phosphatidylinositol phospholipase C, delta|eukprot:5266421-Prymnesium_polylepis.1